MTNEQLLSINTKLLGEKVKLYEMMINVFARKAVACLASTKADYQANVDSLINDVIIVNNSVNGDSND